MTYSLETVKRIYNDNTGDYLEIGPDSDGLDMIEMRSVHLDMESKTPIIDHRIVIEPEALDLVIQALESMRKR